jgi:general stress protein 26
MIQQSDIEAYLDVGRQIMTAAGCASLVTVDEKGQPSSRPVRTFPSDDALTKISIPTDSASRKTAQARMNPSVLLSYVDTASRGYVTIIGSAKLNDRSEDKQAIWVDPFSAFWPAGPQSESYLLIDVTPERIEMRSYTQGVAEDPTRWTPQVLERTETGRWEQSG